MRFCFIYFSFVSDLDNLDFNIFDDLTFNCMDAVRIQSLLNYVLRTCF